MLARAAPSGLRMAARAAAHHLAKRPLGEEMRELRHAVKEADAPRAVELLARCSETPDVMLYNQLLMLLVEPAQRTHMQAVRDHMCRHGVAGDEGTLSIEVRALTQAGELQRAIDALEVATSGGLVPRLRTFSPVLHALIAKRELRLAEELKERMDAAGVKGGEEEAVGLVVAAAHAADTEAGVVYPSFFESVKDLVQCEKVETGFEAWREAIVWQTGFISE